MKRHLPVPKDEFAARLTRTQDLMAEQGLEGLVVFGGRRQGSGNLRYLTNHRTLIPGHSAFVLPARGSGILVVPGGMLPEAVANVATTRTGPELVQQTVAAVKECGGRDTAWGLVSRDAVPARFHIDITRALPAVEWRDAGALVERQRVVKSAAEIAWLEKAASIGARGLAAGREAAKPGASHREVELAIVDGCLLAGVHRVGSITVASGSGLAADAPQPDPQARLDEGDLVSLSARGWVEGYAFDLSRATVAGRASAEQVDYMAHLVEATTWMLGRMLPGEELVYYPVESRGRMIEARAQGTGLEYGEKPRVVERKPFMPQVGMVLCVAPVVDSDEHGRLAHGELVAIGADGPQVLGRG
jgi:Xaa-Pro aminopeptidase